jgi:hypothetical protein
MMNKQMKLLSFLKEFKWLIAVTAMAALFMLYYDLSGKRMFTSSSQQQWSSSGPGYHK